MKIVTASFALLFFFSCGEPVSVKPPADSASSDSLPYTSVQTVSIGSTGLSLELPPDMRITVSQDTNFVFATISPKDTAMYDVLEAVIYIGNSPNKDNPEGDYVRTEEKRMLLGKEVTWVKFTTTRWQHEEVIIDYKTGQQRYLHAWCNGRNAAELQRAMAVLLTLRETPAN
jgi:hypothetical protein